MTVRKPVFHHCGADALTVEPFCGVLTFMDEGSEPIRSARTDDDHLPVRILRKVKLEPCAVSGELQIHVLGKFLRLCAAVRFAGAECDSFDSLIDILTFRVQTDNLVGLAAELFAGYFWRLLLAVHAFQLLSEPPFQSRRELRPARSQIVLADFRIQSDAKVSESPAVTAFRVDVKFGRNLVADKSLIELHRTCNRHSLVVGAHTDECRGSGRCHITVSGVHPFQSGIFVKPVVPLYERLVLPVCP